jgi:hypothetical protein
MSIMNKNGQNENAQMKLLPELHINAENHQPCVNIGGKMYYALAELIAAHPDFGRTDRLSDYCDLLLHFHPGPGCILIDDADEFRARYRKLRQLLRPASSPFMNIGKIPPPTAEQAEHPDVPPPLDPAFLENTDNETLPQTANASFLQPVLDDTTPADFDPFDLSEIAPPRIEQDKLIFYAEQVRHCIPYRVEVPWPTAQEGEVNFMLLPLLCD